MKLIEYEGKRVKILSVNGNLYTGTVGDYCYPEDNENGLEMIVLDVETKNGEHVDQAIGFYGNEIKFIEVVVE